MNNLVFLKTNDYHEEPFTTSKTISERTETDHKSVVQLIEDHINDLQIMGEVRFENEFNPETSRTSKNYILNEPQSTLLITFMKNSSVVVKFKIELVRQFYAMRKELNKREITREIVKEGRRQLTDIIKEKEPGNKWRFKHYTDLDYKCVLGMNAKQFETKYNIPNGKIRDYLEADKLQQIGILEAANKALIGAGYTYEEIKDILGRKFLASKAV
jgi:phage regulator Rha-like protein